MEMRRVIKGGMGGEGWVRCERREDKRLRKVGE